ncbi:FAP189 [Auxenochlorella protothecoides x Auxenochlorella symbiontica]
MEDRDSIGLEALLRAAREREEDARERCTQLEADAAAQSAKALAALQEVDDAHATIEGLQKEAQNAWKASDASLEKELQAKAQITRLQVEVDSLTQLLEQGTAATFADEAEVEELIRQKDEAAAQRDAHMAAVAEQRSEILRLSERLRAAESERALLEGEAATLKEAAAEQRSAAERETRRRERLEREVKEARALLEARQAELRESRASAAAADDHLQRLRVTLRDTQAGNERLQKEWNQATERSARLRKDLDTQLAGNERAAAGLAARQAELEAKVTANGALKAELEHACRATEVAEHRLRLLERQKAELERSHDFLRTEVAGLESALEAAQRDAMLQAFKQEALKKEHERLMRSRSAAENTAHVQAEAVKAAEVDNRILQQQVAVATAQLHALEKAQRKAKRELEGAEHELGDAQRHRDEVETANALAQTELKTLHRELKDMELEWRAAAKRCAVLEEERAAHRLQLQKAQQESTSAEGALRLAGIEAAQLGKEVAHAEDALKKERASLVMAQARCAAVQEQANSAKQELAATEERLAGARQELQATHARLAGSEQARIRLERTLDAALRIRDGLAVQLVAQGSTVHSQHEKIRLQESALQRGHAQYQERLAEARYLRTQVSSSIHELSIAKGALASTSLMRKELQYLTRCLLQEQARVKALNEELDRPLNVHRWRKLAGTDPDAYELTLKVHALQKRLILKTEEVAQKELLLQAKEQTYQELKEAHARMPGTDAAEQSSIQQAVARDRAKQLKVITSQLAVANNQILEYKLEVERLKEENKSRKGTSESVPVDKREGDAAADVKTHSDAKTLPEARAQERASGAAGAQRPGALLPAKRMPGHTRQAPLGKNGLVDGTIRVVAC